VNTSFWRSVMNRKRLMTTFKDTKSREWTLRLDFAALQTIRDAAQVDLGDVEQLANTWAGLLYDDAKSLQVIWLAISRAADPLGVKQSDFLEAMTGDTLQAALEALGAAIESFTQPRKRGMVERAIRGVNEGMKQAIAKAEVAIEQALTQETTKALEALGESPLSVQE
jgi:hypothetical protein